MNDLITILKQHQQKYPLMQRTDALKLIYQHSMGAGHMIPSPERSLAYLQQECSELTFEDPTGVEPIGNGRVRLYLSEILRKGYSPELINKLFVLCANRPTNREDLLKNLALLEPYTDLTDYYQADCPAVRHSQAYRDAYHPAYRVMDEDCTRVLPLLDALDKAPKPLTIAIDGMAGAGKTTLAALLSQLFDCSIVHMDDFFLPFELRTPQRLAQPGGNVHYERILTDVIPHLGMEFSYPVFDCSDGTMDNNQAVKPADIIIIEGSYSMHPALQHIYDLTVFLQVSPEEQARRIRKRNGEEMLKMFQNRWIPMESQYHEHYQIREKADYIF